MKAPEPEITLKEHLLRIGKIGTKVRYKKYGKAGMRAMARKRWDTVKKKS